MTAREQPSISLGPGGENFATQAALLEARLYDDPQLAIKALGYLVLNPLPSENDKERAKAEEGLDVAAAISTYDTLLRTNLLRHILFDDTTQEQLDNDQNYAQLLKLRTLNSNWSAGEVLQHRTRVGATELKFFAGQILLSQTDAGADIIELVQPATETVNKLPEEDLPESVGL